MLLIQIEVDIEYNRTYYNNVPINFTDGCDTGKAMQYSAPLGDFANWQMLVIVSLTRQWPRLTALDNSLSVKGSWILQQKGI